MGKKKKYNNNNIKGRFIPLPITFLKNSAVALLSPYAAKLFIDLMSQYNGFNNGDLTCAWSVMEKRGWKSRDTLSKYCIELLDKGFIIKTRQGGRNKCNLYALTMYCIDDCKGKLDGGINPTLSPPGGWLRV